MMMMMKHEVPWYNCGLQASGTDRGRGVEGADKAGEGLRRGDGGGAAAKIAVISRS